MIMKNVAYDQPDMNDRYAAALRDIKGYLGKERFDTLSIEMAKVTNCEQFSFYCMIAGIEGFPVVVWYEHLHGLGAWKDF